MPEPKSTTAPYKNDNAHNNKDETTNKHQNADINLV